MRFVRITVAALLLFALGMPLPAGKASIEQRFQLDLPMPEAAERVTAWMRSTGLTVERQERADGSILLVGGGNGRSGRVSLEVRPFSALGAVVSIVPGEGESLVDPDELRAVLLAGDAIHVSRADARQGVRVPEPVLSQIESVACIHAESNGHVVQFSGFFIDADGLILSTAHDLLEQERVTIQTNTGISYEGDVIKADFTRDLALIRVDQSKEVIVRLNEGRNLLTVGESLYSIGCPMELRGTIQSGYISGPPRKVGEGFLWQADIEVQPGSSGSPVFVGEGALVGVIKGRHREDGDIGFLIPLETVVDFLREYFAQ